MKRTLFYSWQSDLPSSSNLNFIENCLISTTKKLKSLKPISIELSIDKATREMTGSPDIAESIFHKINKCSVFIADISVINSSSKKQRKTPNPNVLIELGYAARTLGWEKIICIYNRDYGDFEDLPFDLRNRRIMDYNIKNVIKLDIKKDIISKLEKTIIEMNNQGILTDKVVDFLKKEIDQEILSLLFIFIAFLSKPNNKIDPFKAIQDFLKLSRTNILEILENKKILGFYIFKSFEYYENKFHNFVNQAMSSSYFNREILNSLIDIYEWFSLYSSNWTRYSSNLFIKLEEKDESCFIVHSSKIAHGNKFPDRYLLMKKINKKESQVCNFGDFYPGHVPNLTIYYKFNKDYLDKYVDVIQMLIKSINNWIELTNNEIIFDFVKNFRIKKADGDWL